MTDRTKWLNGWPRIDNRFVLMGTGIYCAGCGKDHGVITVAFPDGYKSPEKDPDWPFPAESCPVCEAFAREGFDSWPPRTVELYRRLKVCEALLAQRRGED